MRASLDSVSQEVIACRKCPRLVAWREQVAQVRRTAYRDQEYWGRPVPGFGDPAARVLVVGLAPGAHGSNRTGRQFTGDASGKFLFPALCHAGFASQPESRERDDGLILRDMYITAAARCAPPGNKPNPDELETCRPYLAAEMELIKPKVIVCLGQVAFGQVLRVLRSAGGNDRASKTFAHGAACSWGSDLWLLCSYHPSQQNTSTGRLTEKMFAAIWAKAKRLAAGV